MSEINPIQTNKPVNTIESKQKINPVSSSLSKETKLQLQYDEAEESITKEQLEKAVSEANNHIVGVNAQFEYRIHEGTDRIMVKLIDTESHDVIREIPPEKMLDMVAEIWKRVGLVIDNQK